MDRTIDRAHNGISCLQILWLMALAPLALQLALAFPTQRRDAPPARDRDYRDYALYFQAHQLFRCDPEELNEPRLNDLARWCRCLQLVGRHEESGVQNLTDAECRFVAQVLDDLGPDSPPVAGLRTIYESCRQSLDRRQAAKRDSPIIGFHAYGG